MNTINLDAILDNEQYFDVELSTDETNYDKDIINSNTVIKDGLAIHFDINNSLCFSGLSVNGVPTKITSLSAWTGAKITNNFTLSDVGLTMSDWGRFKSLTGETLKIDVTGSTKLELYSVTGLTASTSSYNISSANTGNIGNYLSLSGGGYFNGFWKLSGYEFEILPPRTELGWYFENWLKFSGQSGSNSNFFLYMGVKQEDKFWNIFSGETGLTTTSGISISPSVSANTDLDLANNVLAFRFSGDTLGWRKISGKTDCFGVVSGITIQEGYSKHGIFDNFSGASDSTDWINVGIRFKRYNLIDSCTVKSGTTAYKGDLTFYLNARPVYNVSNFEEPLFKSLSVHKTKQQGIPFSLSWGGGSFGLKESNTTEGLDILDTGKTIQNNFDGNLQGGISVLRFYVKPLAVSEIVHNFNVERGRYNRTESFGGRNIKINRGINT